MSAARLALLDAQRLGGEAQARADEAPLRRLLEKGREAAG